MPGSSFFISLLLALFLAELVEGVFFDVDVEGHVLRDVKNSGVYVSQYGSFVAALTRCYRAAGRIRVRPLP
jgi:cytochrome bd-type quinol oxidase subunit 2